MGFSARVNTRVISFGQFLTEDSDGAGTIEICKTSLDKARAFAIRVFNRFGRAFEHELPDFDKHYSTAQGRSFHGTENRLDMPVIREEDVRELQARLEGGTIDIRPPHAKKFAEHPFPDGLSGDDAKKWLKYGLPVYDKAPIADDVVKCSEDWVAAERLIPVQQQIYLDKAVERIAKRGDIECIAHTQAKHLIISSDNHIIDGHHRWLSIMLIDPSIILLTLKIHLPLSTLLPLTLAYSDAIGNERNQ